ncbi:MAG: peptide ABC transporter substrate-binding protein [Synoicihabitans sp.]
MGLLILAVMNFNGCRDRQTLVEQANANNTLILANGTEPADLDPQIVTGSPESRIVLSLFEGLVRYHPESLDPLPAVAERWELADDQVTYTFFLRPDAKWSDGQPVTARDFHRAYQRMLSPTIASENAENLYFLEGAADFHQGRTTDFSRVGCRVIDDATLELRAARPTPFFVRMLSARGWFPLPIHILEKHGALERKGTPWTRPENIVGNGPFVLDAWRPNQLIEVSRSETYWNRETIGVDRIRFLPIENATTEEAAYRSGQIHRTASLPIGKIETYQRERPNELRIAPFSGTYYYAFNVNRPPLDNPKVRQALALAIDREALTREVTRAGERVAGHFTPPGVSGYYSEVPGAKFDLGRAKALLAEAGYPNGEGFPTLTLLYNTAENHRIIAEAVQQMWRKGLGVDIQMENQEWQVYLDTMHRHDFDISRAAYIVAPDDPTRFFEGHRTGHGFNISGWSDPVFDQTLEASLEETDPARRAELFAKMEARMMEEMPIAPVYHYTMKYLIRPEVKNWTDNMIQTLPLREVRLEP